MDMTLHCRVSRERYKMLIGPENGYRSLLISLFFANMCVWKWHCKGEKSLWKKILKDKSRSRNFYSFSGQWSRRRCSIYWGLRNCVREYHLVECFLIFPLYICHDTEVVSPCSANVYTQRWFQGNKFPLSVILREKAADMYLLPVRGLISPSYQKPNG